MFPVQLLSPSSHKYMYAHYMTIYVYKLYTVVIILCFHCSLLSPRSSFLKRLLISLPTITSTAKVTLKLYSHARSSWYPNHLAFFVFLLKLFTSFPVFCGGVRTSYTRSYDASIYMVVPCRLLIVTGSSGCSVPVDPVPDDPTRNNAGSYYDSICHRESHYYHNIN